MEYKSCPSYERYLLKRVKPGNWSSQILENWFGYVSDYDPKDHGMKMGGE